jgi:hypothetical protein
MVTDPEVKWVFFVHAVLFTVQPLKKMQGNH